MADLEIIPVAIAPGASLSAAIGIGFKVIVGFSLPTAGWVTAPLTFQISPDGVIFQEYIDGTNSAAGQTPLQVPPGTGTILGNTFVMVASGTFDGVNMLKIRSGTVGTPVVQTGGAIIGVVVRTVAF
jgi:hypothetical protein